MTETDEQRGIRRSAYATCAGKSSPRSWRYPSTSWRHIRTTCFNQILLSNAHARGRAASSLRRLRLASPSNRLRGRAEPEPAPTERD